MLKYSKKWSILIVNYRSSVYLKWQLKILYEFNDINDFELIIIDNSVDENEKNNLLNLISDYQKEFNNIKLHFYQPHNKTASGQHGEAIEYAKQYIEGQYLLIHDPDFFWLKKNYLNTLENLLKNHVAVGAPYKGNSMNGNSKFPSAFGCAYKFSDVKNISFEPFIDGDFEKSWEIFNKFQNEQHQIWKNNPKLAKINYDFSFDVGWQIRNQLSNEDNDDNFITFNQFNIKNGLIELLNLKISHSFETISSIYFFNDKIIALHLFRGTFTGQHNEHCDPKINHSEELFKTRDLIAKFLYDQISLKNKDLNLCYLKIIKKKKRKKIKDKIKKFINFLKK